MTLQADHGLGRACMRLNMHLIRVLQLSFIQSCPALRIKAPSVKHSLSLHLLGENPHFGQVSRRARLCL